MRTTKQIFRPADWPRLWASYTHANEKCRFEYDRRTSDAGDEADELVCMKREGRPPSPLKGVRRGPHQLAGQEVML